MLRWAGSKRQLIPELAKYWDPNFNRYVEPFAGSARLFFHLAPRKALLGDINDELIGMYLHLRQNCVGVHRTLKDFEVGKRAYRRIRKLDPSCLTKNQRAARLIYLNHYCFNGLYRTNKLGRFNVPYGGGKAGPLPTLTSLKQHARLLRKASLKSGDFECVLQMVQPGDFVYLDPPFSISGRRMFHQYDATAFGIDDLRRLRGWMESLDGLNVSFLVSFTDSEEGGYLSRGFHTHRVEVRRSIAGFALKRVRATELLISNRLPSSAS